MKLQIKKDKNLKCPCCNNKIDKNSFSQTYIANFNKQEYKLYFCEICDLNFWTPLQIDVNFYSDEHNNEYKIFHSGLQNSITHWHKKFFENMSIGGGKTLLNIGSGSGVFANEALKNGYDVTIFDFDEKSVNSAKKKFSIQNAYSGSFDNFIENMQRQNIKFDVITFFEVLEHQDNPQNFIEKIKTILKDNGYICGSVPNRNRGDVNILKVKDDRFVDFPPHHFLRFSKKSLNNFFTRNGFNSVKLYSVKEPFLDVTTFIETEYLGFLLNSLKTFIKKIIFQKESKESNNLSFNALQTKESNKIKSLIVDFLRLFRAIILSPITLIIYPIYNYDGTNIYFQVKKSSN